MCMERGADQHSLATLPAQGTVRQQFFDAFLSVHTDICLFSQGFGFVCLYDAVLMVPEHHSIVRAPLAIISALVVAAQLGECHAAFAALVCVGCDAVCAGRTARGTC